MRTRISSTDAARNLGEYLARIKHKGEAFLIVRNNKPIAELGPVSGLRGATVGTLWTALREVSVDAGFAEDLERVNSMDAVMKNPWA